MQLSLTWMHVGVGGFTPLYPFERPRQNGSFRIGTTILFWVYSTDPPASDVGVPFFGDISGEKGLRHKKHRWYEACNDPKLSEIGYIMLNHLEPATKNQRDYPPIRMFSNIGDTEHWSWSISSRYYLPRVPFRSIQHAEFRWTDRICLLWPRKQSKWHRLHFSSFFTLSSTLKHQISLPVAELLVATHVESLTDSHPLFLGWLNYPLWHAFSDSLAVVFSTQIVVHIISAYLHPWTSINNVLLLLFLSRALKTITFGSKWMLKFVLLLYMFLSSLSITVVFLVHGSQVR